MDNRDEVKAFLSSRRAKVTPEQAGLAHYGRNRRVPGLRRRGELARISGTAVVRGHPIALSAAIRLSSEPIPVAVTTACADDGSSWRQDCGGGAGA